MCFRTRKRASVAGVSEGDREGDGAGEAGQVPGLGGGGRLGACCTWIFF